MRVLVIGGTRFIGAALVRRLHALGHEVTLFHRGQTEPETLPDLPHIHGDQRDLAQFTATFARLAPDVVVAMWIMTPQEAWTLMSVLQGYAGRVVVPSSADVYRAYGYLTGKESGPLDPHPLTEASPLRTRFYLLRRETPRPSDTPDHWMDDYEKIVVEHLVLGQPQLPGTIVRLPMVYGPGDPQHRLFEYLKRMDDQRPAILLSDVRAQWQVSRGYVENVAEALSLAATDKRASGRCYNVADGAMAEKEWIQRLGQAAGWTGAIQILPMECLPASLTRYHELYRQHGIIDTTRIHHELGYTPPIALDEALWQTIAWERVHPPAQMDPTQFDYPLEDQVLATLSAERQSARL